MTLTVLALADSFLPGFRGGGPPRSLANIGRALGKEFRLHLVTRNHDKDPSRPFRDVPTGIWTEMAGWQVLYVPEQGVNGRQVRDALAELRPDVLYLNSYFSRFTRSAVANPVKRLPPVILAPRGELLAPALRIKARRKLAYMRTVGRLLHTGRRISVWQATSPAERVAIEAFKPRAAVRVVPSLPTPLSTVPQRRPKNTGSLRALFLGRIAPIKNLRNTLRALQGVTTCEIYLHVYGPVDDAAYLAECQHLAAKAQRHANVTVTFAGELRPDLVSQIVAGHDLLVAPSFSENYGHSIAEALQVGTPVLTTAATPWAHLPLQRAGAIVDPHSVDAIASALTYYASLDSRSHGAICEQILAHRSEILGEQRAIALTRSLFHDAASAPSSGINT